MSTAGSQVHAVVKLVFDHLLLVNNESDKEIRSIKWTATLINRETQETIQSFPLETKRKIAPHKSSKLKERLVLPLKKLQGQVVSATQPIKDPTRTAVDEKYEIVEILYADKSVSKPWCVDLRQANFPSALSALEVPSMKTISAR